MATLRKTNGINRRRNGERFDWEDAKVTINFEKGEADGKSLNLSEGGITFVTDADNLPEIGDDAILNIESAAGDWIVCEGECIRIERVGRMGCARSVTFRFADPEGRGFASGLISGMRSAERLADIARLEAALGFSRD